MASRKKAAASKPTLPYCTRPAALRKFLEQVPKRPKPAVVNEDTLNSWDIKGGESYTAIRVLKALGFLSSNNEPNETYTQFMHAQNGPIVLAQRIREVYAKLFEQSLEPHKESNDTLRNLFNIYSGGAEPTIQFQIQTFKALCDYADFSTTPPASANVVGSSAMASKANADTRSVGATGSPIIHIDLHIHLPENKSRRDYEYMFEDIARYIYGRTDTGNKDES